MNNEALIAELRERAERAGTNVAQCMREAADALEAAARVPVQGEPNDDRAEIFYCPIHGDLLDPRMSRSYRCLDAPGGHEYVTPRAPVPDAATEETEWEYGFELIEPDDRNVFEREGDFISAAFAYRAAKKRIDEERHPDVPSLQYSIIRRRKAGPWLPVEGESKP